MAAFLPFEGVFVHFFQIEKEKSMFD